MAASAGEAELVDLSSDDDAPDPGDGPRRRVRAGTAALVGVVALGGLVAAGAWQHAGARAAQRAAAQAAAEDERMHEGRSRANALEQRLWEVRSSMRAVTDAVGGSATGADDVVWWPADLGPRASHVDEPVDLQVVGVWPQPADAAGSQRIGYRLVAGLSSASGGEPCAVPAVRVTDWGPSSGGGGALPCRVMAAGLRGTAVREGSAGPGADGAPGVHVREVVLVSGGRAASVAVWSTGGAALPLDGPALGAAAAALLAAAGPSS